MKVLLCHSYYLQRGGEDCCFEEERDMLRARGHEVVEFVRHNRELVGMSAAAAAMSTLWNRRAVREFRDLIGRERPAVMHCTNTFPLISPGVCHAAHRAGVAVVQALHNYRWLCAGAYFMRDGAPCEDCLGKRIPLAAIRHKCYRDSAAASAAVVAMQVAHRTLGNWTSKIDAFFTLTEFARQRFIAGGFPAERVHVKANSVAPDPSVGRGEGRYIAFVGRLSPEKGVATLLEAWRNDASLPPLVIAGDGPLAGQVRAAVDLDSRITWRGQLPLTEVHNLLRDASALVMPSLWYETFGRTIAESFAAATPAIVSRLGAMAELVDEGRTGFLFKAGDAPELAQQVNRVCRLPNEERAAMRQAARTEFERRFTPERNYARLIEIYGLARAEADRRRLAPRAATAEATNLSGGNLSYSQATAIRRLSTWAGE